MIDIIFEEPRSSSPEEIFLWAKETTEKLNKLQSTAKNEDKENGEGKNGIRER